MQIQYNRDKAETCILWLAIRKNSMANSYGNYKIMADTCKNPRKLIQFHDPSGQWINYICCEFTNIKSIYLDLAENLICYSFLLKGDVLLGLTLNNF